MVAHLVSRTGLSVAHGAAGIKQPNLNLYLYLQLAPGLLFSALLCPYTTVWQQAKHDMRLGAHGRQSNHIRRNRYAPLTFDLAQMRICLNIHVLDQARDFETMMHPWATWISSGLETLR
ncbi:MAG: hypothetical protein DCC55_03485 [Chloroflexi bacterium]|nr:MAG: hypothetical protein DCC55_03485 [Chloroflexota bacterium]